MLLFLKRKYAGIELSNVIMLKAYLLSIKRSTNLMNLLWCNAFKVGKMSG